MLRLLNVCIIIYCKVMSAVFGMILDANSTCVAIGYSNFMYSDVTTKVHALRYAFVSVPSYYRIGISVYAALILITLPIDPL